MTDIKLEYDNEASGPFSEGEIVTFGGGATGELVILRDNGTVGSMYVALISGTTPANDETITGGTSAATADVNGTPFNSRFPLKVRDDLTYTESTGNIRLSGSAPGLGTTHSCLYDNEASGPFTTGEILTFGNGSTAELIQLTDNGTDGELFFRMIDVALPSDNDTITGGTSSATGNVDGAIHLRAYKPLEIHYFYSDLGDDESFVGDDEQDRTKPRISQRVGVTDVEFLGNANIDDALSYRLYGGSVTQGGGSQDSYNAVAIGVVDADGATEPVIIVDGALWSATTTEYWKNGYVPNAASRVNILIKTEAAGTIVDRRVARFRALEYGRQNFTPNDATLGAGVTPVSLVATNDGNNETAEATVATWTDAVLTYGFQSVDHNNGNGAQPYWAVGDTGSRTKAQFHERQKWVQRRGTSETIFGVNAQLIVGNDLDIVYDNEALGPFTEGETLTFGSGGTALLLALDDIGTTGNLYCQKMTGDVPADNDTITGGTSSATADINGTPVTRLIINNLMGTFTGSAFNPANKGITLEAADATTEDVFTDLLGATQSPPNNQQGVTNTATGNILTMFPWDGSAVDAVGDPDPEFARLTLDTALTGAAETSVVVNETIPTWAPSSGDIRITLNSGLVRLVAYTSFTGSTFTIPSTDFSGDNASVSNGVMPTGFDGTVSGGQASFTGVYTANQNAAGSGDQQFVCRAQNGSGATPKEPAFTTATFGTGGFEVSITLQDD
jgi:hypothetical protein